MTMTTQYSTPAKVVAIADDRAVVSYRCGETARVLVDTKLNLIVGDEVVVHKTDDEVTCVERTSSWYATFCEEVQELRYGQTQVDRDLLVEVHENRQVLHHNVEVLKQRRAELEAELARLTELQAQLAETLSKKVVA